MTSPRALDDMVDDASADNLLADRFAADDPEPDGDQLELEERQALRRVAGLSTELEAAGHDRVRVHGIKGAPATDKLKVSVAYRAGYKAVGTLVYAWPDALDKAEMAAGVLRERLDRLGLRFDEVLTEYVGAGATHGPLAGPASPELAEVQLRVGVRGSDRASVERFTREIAPLVLNGPPSVTGFAGGRPKVEEIVAYWPALVDKAVVQTRVEVLS